MQYGCNKVVIFNIQWEQAPKYTTTKTLNSRDGFLKRRKRPRRKLWVYQIQLESDYEELYPDSSMKMYSELPQFSEKVLSYARKQKDKDIQQRIKEIDEEESADVKNLKCLFLLPFLLGMRTIKRKKGQKCWRPSKIEVSEGFVIHLKSISELKTIVEAKVNKLDKFGLTLQPTPVLIGEEISTIRDSYVYVSGHLYQVSTPIKAIDICFKVIHAVHALYPYESETVWLLLQKCLYGIISEWDKNFISVNLLMQDLGYNKWIYNHIYVIFDRFVYLLIFF
ncbi:uncharacterized protein LOC116162857 [Photinus pyralis]|uniref:uncharacterized protein LOC116162857 n=1 Tax=Photinus pyralis TaxID=7054 RepID=UPI001266F515|nr:uncharacterized protein LOC116162857 [Photinus pyralis]